MENAKRILCVDDDLITLDLLKACLGPEDGFEVDIASNVPDGLEIALKNIPDAILLDWVMPGLSGLEALNAFKNEPKLRELPVFMVTGRTMMRDVERAADCGVTGYFTKPINPILMANRLHRVLDLPPQAA